MTQLITQDMLKQLGEGAKGYEQLIAKGGTTLIDETIKLYIFYGIMGIMQAAVVFIVFGIVLKLLSSVDKMNELPSKSIKTFKATALVLSIIYFTIHSMPHLVDIGKALVAPNLFVAEKGMELIKNKGAKE